MMLLTNKYAPKKLGEILGNTEKIEYVRQWMLQWMSGKSRKPLLVWGPPGVGKTGLAYALGAEYGLDIVEMNASELRNKGRVERVLGGSSLAGTLFGRMRLVLIDDADVLAGRKDSGGGTAIKNFLAESNCPTIVTATNAWEKDLSPIRSECELVELKRINKLSVKKHLDQVSRAEKLDLPAERLEAIAERSHGDMRAALNDLQRLGPSDRVAEKDIFEVVRGVLKADTYSGAKEAVGSSVDYDLLKLWIDENIPYEYEKPEEIAAAYDSLSKADVFDGRIRKQNWVLLKYSIDLATAGVALAKAAPYRKFTKYNFPTWLRAMSQSMERRNMLKSIGTKIGRKVHANRRDALEYLPLLKDFGSKNSQQLMDFYELSEEELAFILETSVSRVKKS
ncbi:MAG TPA: replication factor C large subunit [Candidatus Bilamarchaeum sp.]|nr:replication factor C large subunit [Candidatus Bilamarchaeum sp.]